MSQSRVDRKIVKWDEYTPPREWTPVLDCGHKQLDYDHGLSDEQKANVESNGNVWSCYECGRERDRIHELEAELRRLKRKGGVR